jgi:prephenate dehydratase
MPARVAFQGERGAYGEMAAIQYFSDPALLPLKSFLDVFDAAERGSADFAVLPVENSIEGSVNEIYDLLLKTKLQVIGEVYQRVRHCLVANKGARKNSIKSAHSHPQALAQCRVYLHKHGIEPVPAYDTAGAAKMVKENKRLDAAAIASRRAAELYGMAILDEGIEDKKNNYTRFLVLSPRKRKTGSASRGRNYKTSIIFSVKHVPGSLFGIIGEFAVRGINLTKIESRPTKETPWEYNFYVDFDGQADDSTVKAALKAIRHKTLYIKVLGSYKKAKFR